MNTPQAPGEQLAPASTPSPARVISVKGLAKHFPVRSKGLVRRKVGDVHAVCDVSFDVYENVVKQRVAA